MNGAPPVIVAFRPAAASLGNDVMFSGGAYTHFGDATHWLEPTRFLAQAGLEQGFEFHTEDRVRLERASVFVFGELPAAPGEAQLLRQRHPHLKIILQILETPIGRQWTFDPANHAMFDAVVSYNPKLEDGSRYFAFRIPVGGLETFQPVVCAPWSGRKTACMIANVPNVRPALPRRSGIGMMRNGWRFTPASWWNYITEGGSLYGERLRIAEQCEDALGDRFDIFGPGWTQTQRAGGRRFASARGVYEGSKLDLLQNYRFTIAYENCRNDCGYVSEKMFDAILGGSVPVYLGNERIQEEVPPEAFVDARRFASHLDLVTFIEKMPENQWQRMRDAGAAYLISQAKGRFGSQQYARAIMGAVRGVAGK